MNNRVNQSVAVLAVIALIIFAWDLGRRQALNSFPGDSASSAAPVTIGAESSPGNTGNASAKSKTPKERIFPAVSNGGAVEVEDQPAGMEVKVSSLSLAEMGWVGVRDDDGRVLGAGRFDAGSFKDVTVPLLRATVAGDSYQVLLYTDDGDREFDLQKDTLVMGPDGSVAGANFKAF